MKKQISRLWETFWRQILAYLGVALVVGGFLWWRLGTLVGPSLSQTELIARANASSLHAILSNPLFLPHKLVQFVFIHFGHHGAFWMRSASALWGLAIVLIFFDIVQGWYNRRIALMTSFLLLSSAWFLHFARLGTPNIMFASTIGLFWVGIKLKSVRAPRIRTILASIVIIGSSLYVPGLAWLIVPLLVWQRRLVWHEFRKIPRLLSVVVGLAIVIGLAPLLYGLLLHPSLIRSWLYLPAPLSLASIWSNLWHLPLWLVLKGPELPVYWLGHLPLFDIFSLAMLGLGIYVLSHYRQLDRVRSIVVVFVLAAILAVLNGWLALLIALPALYLTISAGLALLLQQWFTVFPRNPLARAVGVSMVSLLVILSSYYNIRHYFIAWPRNSQTVQAFQTRRQ